MHPLLLHQLADDSVTERRRHPHPNVGGHRRSGDGARPASRMRVRAGGLLIAMGTRLAGTRSASSVLHQRSSVPS